MTESAQLVCATVSWRVVSQNLIFLEQFVMRMWGHVSILACVLVLRCIASIQGFLRTESLVMEAIFVWLAKLVNLDNAKAVRAETAQELATCATRVCATSSWTNV